MLIFDCEIIKAIKGKEPQIAGIEYCEGWRDFKGMGLSCICAYDQLDKRYRVFCYDNFDDFQKLVDERAVIVGFNSIGFDNPLCEANGIHIPREKSYDILVEIWKAAGLSETFEYPSHLGYGLEDMCKVNFDLEKSGNGALAPVLWQQGRFGQVIDYCLNDIKLTKRLLDEIIHDQELLINPKDPDGNLLRLKRPI